MKKSTGDQIYSGVATFGRIEALIGAIIATVIGIIAIIVGIVLVANKPTKTSIVSGTITNAPICTEYIRDNNIYHKCPINVTYTIGGVVNAKNFTTDGELVYQKGDNINVYYNKSNYTDASLQSDNQHVGGIIMIVIGILMIVMSWLWYYATTKSKIAAAAGGTMSIIDMIRR